MNKNKSRLVIGATLLTLLLVFFLKGSLGDRVVEVRLKDSVSKEGGKLIDEEASSVSHDIQIKKRVLNAMLQAGKGTKFKVVLFEGEEIEVNITRRDPLLEKGAILYGTVDGESESSAHFSIYEGAMFAEIVFGNRRRYKIDYKKDGQYKLSEIGPAGAAVRFDGGCVIEVTRSGKAVSQYRAAPRKNFLQNRYMLDPAIRRPAVFCSSEDEEGVERQKKRLSMRLPMGGLQPKDARGTSLRARAEAFRRPIGRLPTPSGSGGGGGGGGGGSAGRVTVMFCYTSELDAAIGVNGVVAKAGSYEATMNKCFTNSGIQNNVKTVGTYKISKDFSHSSADLTASLDWMRKDTGGVGVERDKLKADLVSLLVKGDPNPQGAYTAGMAYLLSSKATNASLGFSVFWDSVSNLVFAHEVGHNFGCGHSLKQSSNTGALPYSHGDYFQGDDNKTYATIMSYTMDVAGSVWCEYFSSPNVKYKGSATSNDAATADNVKSIKELIPYIIKNRE